MKTQKRKNPSIYLCKALMKSDERGIYAIDKLKKNNFFNADVIYKLTISIRYNRGWKLCGVNAVHIAVWKGRIKSLERLLVIKNVKNQWTDLHASMLCSKATPFECVKLLVETKNININAQDERGFTILMSASNSYLKPNSAKCVKILFSQPNIEFNIRNQFGCTAFYFVFLNSNSRISKMVIRWVIHVLRLGLGTLSQLIIPNNLGRSSKETQKKLNEAIKDAKRLERITCDKLYDVSQWHLIRKGISNNYSVIGFVDKETDENWVLVIMERNRKARLNCFEASVQTFLIFKQELNKDMGNLFALWVWETRGTKIWSF